MGKKASKKPVEPVEEEIEEKEEKVDEEETLETDTGKDAGNEDIFEERSEVAKQFAEEENKEEITEERFYVVPLSRAYMRPPKKRAKRAIFLLREFFKRHMKAEEIVVLPEVNEYVWERGIESPPRKIKIRATKSLEGTVTLYLNV